MQNEAPFFGQRTHTKEPPQSTTAKNQPNSTLTKFVRPPLYSQGGRVIGTANATNGMGGLLQNPSGNTFSHKIKRLNNNPAQSSSGASYNPQVTDPNQMPQLPNSFHY